jgi:hypothetical protein
MRFAVLLSVVRGGEKPLRTANPAAVARPPIPSLPRFQKLDTRCVVDLIVEATSTRDHLQLVRQVRFLRSNGQAERLATRALDVQALDGYR